MVAVRHVQVRVRECISERVSEHLAAISAARRGLLDVNARTADGRQQVVDVLLQAYALRGLEAQEFISTRKSSVHLVWLCRQHPYAHAYAETHPRAMHACICTHAHEYEQLGC